MKEDLNIRKDLKCKKNKEVPNKVTLEAYKEVEDMETHPEKYETFKSIDSLMEDLLN